MKSGDPHLHGWVDEVHTGEMEAYDAKTESFIPLHADHIPDAVRRGTRKRERFETPDKGLLEAAPVRPEPRFHLDDNSPRFWPF